MVYEKLPSNTEEDLSHLEDPYILLEVIVTIYRKGSEVSNVLELERDLYRSFAIRVVSPPDPVVPFNFRVWVHRPDIGFS